MNIIFEEQREHEDGARISHGQLLLAYYCHHYPFIHSEEETFEYT